MYRLRGFSTSLKFAGGKFRLGVVSFHHKNGSPPGVSHSEVDYEKPQESEKLRISLTINVSETPNQF